MTLTDFPEYALLNPQQRIAFSWHPKITQYAVDQKLKLGKQRKVLINTSAGHKELILTIIPSGDTVTLEGLHFAPRKAVYLYKEPGQPGILISRKTLLENYQVVFLLQEFRKIDAVDREKSLLKMQKQMQKMLSPAARAAIKDKLNTLLDGNYAGVLHAWFTMKRFKNIPASETFEKMRDLGSITLNYGPDGFGHTTGSSIRIDWTNKTFSQPERWSTDD